MRATQPGYLVIAVATAVLLTNCTGGARQEGFLGNASVQVGTERLAPEDDAPSVTRSLRGRIHRSEHPAWMKLRGELAASGGYTYVGQQYTNAINLYRANNIRNRPPVCQIGLANAQGMATDRSGTLYVTGNLPGGVAVQTFSPICGKPGLSFIDPDGLAVDPAVDGSTLYVTNLIDNGQLAAIIEVYANGASRMPSGRLSDPSAYKGIGVAVDSHHSLFWSYATQAWSGGQVIKFPRGSMPGVILKPTVGKDFPGGVLLDRFDNLLVVDQDTNSIHVFAPPYSAPAFSTILLKGTAVYCAMEPREERLHCLDYQYGSVDVYAYPVGTYIYSYTNGIDSRKAPIGIAILPS
jgi:hypothetical protein